MAVNRYWAERIVKQQDVLYNKTLKQHNTQLAKYYSQAIKRTQDDIGKLYDKICADTLDGKLTVNSLYRYDRYFEVMNNLNGELNKLGQKEIKVTKQSLYNMYTNVAKDIGKASGTMQNSFVMDINAKKVLENIWCADGKHWSERVWNNTAQLQKSIEKGLVDSVSRGVSKDQMVKEIKVRYAVDFNKADRIARTELTNVQNQSASDSYTAAGIEEYQFLATEDDRTSDECSDLNGQIFRFDEAVIGENMPPIHCNCRCTIIPVLN